jgi:hypothetical protein
MSARALYAVQCDEPTCSRIGRAAENNLATARAAAADDGWRHRTWPARNRSGPTPSLDFCPDHANHADAPAPPFKRKPAR